MTVNCLRFSPDYTRLAIGLAPGQSQVQGQAMSGQGVLKIYKVNYDGSVYDAIQQIETSEFDMLPIPELHAITSCDWSLDCECIRLTFGDYRKMHIVKYFDENGGNEAYKIDNACTYRFSSHDGNKKTGRQTWSSETCLLRWETTGIFRPDPSRIKCVEKLATKTGNYVLVGLNMNSSQNSSILQLFQWPCLSPLYPVLEKVDLAPGYGIKKLASSVDGQKHVVCLVTKGNDENGKILIYKV